jgi:hypothetical protein
MFKATHKKGFYMVHCWSKLKDEKSGRQALRPTMKLSRMGQHRLSWTTKTTIMGVKPFHLVPWAITLADAGKNWWVGTLIKITLAFCDKK